MCVSESSTQRTATTRVARHACVHVSPLFVCVSGEIQPKERVASIRSDS